MYNVATKMMMGELVGRAWLRPRVPLIVHHLEPTQLSGFTGGTTMSKKRWALLGLAMCFILVSRPVFAHHGTANFQMDQVSTIKGTVVDYELINPHVKITLKVEQEGGKAVEWNVEGVSLNMMVRAGFKRDSVKAGDIVSVTGHPGKNGTPALVFMKIVLADGRTISAPYE
jgi:Family of unknown function (DUF6152)